MYFFPVTDRLTQNQTIISRRGSILRILSQNSPPDILVLWLVSRPHIRRVGPSLILILS